jgi:hypothetical protein
MSLKGDSLGVSNADYFSIGGGRGSRGLEFVERASRRQSKGMREEFEVFKN